MRDKKLELLKIATVGELKEGESKKFIVKRPDRETEAFRQKAKAGNGRRRLEPAQLTFLRADMCGFAG